MRTMKNHFGEGDARGIFKQMTNATQGLKQTPYQFITSMFSLRDRVVELMRQEKTTTKPYMPELIQQEMQRGIYAGLRDEGIRQDLKMLLRQPDVDDDDLLDELQLAEASRREHERRFEEAEQKSVPASLPVISTESSNDQISKSRTNDSHKSSDEKSLNSICINNLVNSNNSSNNDQANRQPTIDLHLLVSKISSLLEMMMQQMIAPIWVQVNELMAIKNTSHAQGRGDTLPRGSSSVEPRPVKLPYRNSRFVDHNKNTRAQSVRLGEGAVRIEGAVSEVREESLVGEAAVSEGAVVEAKYSSVGLDSCVDKPETYNDSEENGSGSEYYTAVSSDNEGGTDQCRDSGGKMKRYRGCWVGAKRGVGRIKRSESCRDDGSCSNASRVNQKEEHDEVCRDLNKLSMRQARQEEGKLKDGLVKLVSERMLPVMASRCL